VSAEAVGERAPIGGRLDRDIRWLFTLGGITTATILPFFSPLLQSWGITPDRIGLILSAQALAAVVAVPLWSHEADTRWGTTRTLVASTLATAACAGLLILVGVDVWVVGVVAAMMAAAGAPGTALGDALALGVLGRDRTNDYGRIRRFASGCFVSRSTPKVRGPARWRRSWPTCPNRCCSRSCPRSNPTAAPFRSPRWSC